MKRGLVLTLCAVALAAGTAHAQNVQLSLNLRYTNPNVPGNGGQWFLVAKTDSANGIAAVNAYISNINTAGIVYGTTGNVGSADAVDYTVIAGPQINANLNAGNPYVVPGTPVNVVYFQDTSAPGVVTGVGTAAFAQRQLTDPLRNTTSWNNATVIASGTFGATRPVFAPKGANVTDANTLASATAPFNNSLDANTTFTVRGDSVIIGANGLPVANPLESPAGAGLRFGDRNRNGNVSFLGDLNDAISAINTGSGKTWDQGDFSGNGTVSFLADINPAISQIGLPSTPAPAIGAAPEPATVSMLIVGGLLGIASRRRK